MRVVEKAKKHIIIITGTPGVGKHTVANEITKMTDDWHIIDVNKSARRAGLYEYDIDEHTDDATYTTKQHRNVIDIDTDKLADAIKQEITAPRNYIVVGHLAPYVVQATKEVIFAAILRRDPYDLLKVYQNRGYTDVKSRENAGSEALGVITHDTFAASYAKTGQFDTTKKDPKKIAKMILDAACETCHNPHDTTDKNTESWKPIDWMQDDDNGTPTPKTLRMLDDFFKD